MAKSRGILPPRRYWLADEEQYLRDHYADTITTTIAEFLGRTAHQVLAKAHALGLAKTHDYKSTLSRQAITTPGHGSQATRFSASLVPWNTGVKGVCGVQPACRATQFKPGALSPKAAPIGALRVVEGYLQRKVSAAKGNNSVRWRCVHELVWIEANGPVPPGHLIVFKPGRRTADPELITPDAVELVSRAENMLRNTVHRYGPEVASCMKLRAAIRKQISRQADEAATTATPP